MYANSTWVKNQENPFTGDPFQTYNAGPAEKDSGELAPVPFYELESTSPVRELEPGLRVVTAGNEALREGQPVRLVPAE